MYRPLPAQTLFQTYVNSGGCRGKPTLTPTFMSTMPEPMSDTTPTRGYTDDQKYRIFNKEFMPHIDSMYNFAFRLTMDEDDANDLVQDTYLKAFRFINSFQKGTNAKAWLFRILKQI